MRLRGLKAAFAVLLAAAGLACSGGTAAAATVHTFVSSFGSFANVQGLAVDESSGAVYVLDADDGSLHKFSATGAPANFSALGTSVIEGVGSLGKGENQVAVDNSAGPANGDIYIANGSHVGIYAADGSSLGELGEGPSQPWGEPCGVAVDSSGNVYVGLYPGHVNRYAPSASPVVSGDYNGTLSNVGEICNVAADASGSVYADVSWANGAVKKYGALQFSELEIDAEGSLLTERGSAVAVDLSSDDVYIDNGAEVVEYSSAGEPLATAAEYGANRISGSSAVAIDSANNLLYIADNGHGRVDLFGPSAPLVSGVLATYVTATEARLNARINPAGADTAYRFEYGLDTNYGTEVPVSAADIGSAIGDQNVSQAIGGLRPETVYHYRVVASNANGATAGIDRTFTTESLVPTAPADNCANAQARRQQNSTYLPDCRAYEMVSPSNKNGADIFHYNVHSDPAGNVVHYIAEQAFGNVTSGGSLTSDYLGYRSGESWDTHGITPSVPPFGVVNLTMVQALSPDLSKSLIMSNIPLTPDAPGPAADNLYIEDNATGQLTLVSPSELPLPRETGNAGIFYGSPGGNFHRVFFSTTSNRLSGMSGAEPKLYEWVDGSLKNAAILPNGEPAPDPAGLAGPTGELAGRGYPANEGYASGQGSLVSHAVSEDGSRMFFVAPEAFNSNGIPLEGEGPLYVRQSDGVHPSTTVQINVPQRPLNGPDPNGPQPAVFWVATPDGSKAFFVTKERLTDDAGEYDLYRYDVDTGRLLDMTPGSGGQILQVLGVSDDGSRAYYIGGGGEIRLSDNGHTRIIADNGGAKIDDIGSSSDQADHQESTYDYLTGTRVTPDGSHLIFISTARLTAFDNRGFGEMYMYDMNANAGQGELVCASCVSESSPIGGVVAETLEKSPGVAYVEYRNRGISDDGRFVFFSTHDALVPADSNGKVDVYEYDSVERQVHLISSGRGSDDSFFADASSDGKNVFFLTRVPLTDADTDSNVDLYDARVMGGFDGAQRPSAPCAGDTCQGRPSTAPSFGSPSSAAVAGAGNLPIAPQAGKPTAKGKKRVPCPRRSVKKRVKGKATCVGKHKQRHTTRRRPGKKTARRLGR